MAKEKVSLNQLHDLQAQRLESELRLHWIRINLAFVALSAATGYIIYSLDGQVESSSLRECGYADAQSPGILIDALLAIKCLGAFALSWYLVVLTISGSYWIRVAEQKLRVIQEFSTGIGLYWDYLKDDDRPISLTMFTKILFSVVGVIYLFASSSIVVLLLSTHSWGLWVTGTDDIANEIPVMILLSVVTSACWLGCVKRQSKLVFGSLFSHPGDHFLIEMGPLNESTSSRTSSTVENSPLYRALEKKYPKR